MADLLNVAAATGVIVVGFLAVVGAGTIAWACRPRRTGGGRCCQRDD